MKTNLLLAFPLLLNLAACGREVEVETYKTAGVGLNPAEIGPRPVDYGGLIEYNFVDFSGAALPLGLTGLVAFDEVGPGLIEMKPPYALITGTGFVLDADLPQMDSLFGSFGAPLDAVGSCYTNFEPRAYLNTTADVGTEITFTGKDEDFQFRLDRRPGLYPENNVQNVFPYYTSLGSWRPSAQLKRADPGSGVVADGGHEVLRPANYMHAADAIVRFPGGIPPEDAPVSSIPMPLAAGAGDVTLRLPNQPQGIMLSWSGPRYAKDGSVLGDGEQRTCFEFATRPDDPASNGDCAQLWEPPAESGSVVGQMYTAPWETDSGLTFSWVPPEESSESYETVVIGVRLLGPVDTDSEYKRVSRISVPASSGLAANWEEFQQDPYNWIPDDQRPPTVGYREALACESEQDGDFDWVVDPALLKDPEDPTSFIDSLQGEPSYTVAELICNVPDTGEFTVTPEMLSFALDYGAIHGASGAIFYFARTSAKDVVTPPVRDRYGQKRPISPVRLQSSSVKLGRFWWNR
jgi:hypothetical protein